jgi:large subunit ribosomal protein L22
MKTHYKASHRHAHTSARKARLVVDLIRGLPVNTALGVLDRSPQRAAVMIGKVVRSAVANAEQDSQIDPNRLTVSEARVDEGPLLGGHMRWRPAARGRAMPIHKRTSHIHIALSPIEGGADSAAPAPRELSEEEKAKKAASKAAKVKKSKTAKGHGAGRKDGAGKSASMKQATPRAGKQAIRKQNKEG